MIISVGTKDSASLESAIEQVRTTVHRRFSRPIVGNEQYLFEFHRQRVRLRRVGEFSPLSGRAAVYADYLAANSSTASLGTELAAIDDLTASQSLAVGRSIFAPDRAMVIEVVPSGAGVVAKRAELPNPADNDVGLTSVDDIDPAEAHRPLPVDELAPAAREIMEFELDNGMGVILVRSSALPVMEAKIIIGAGKLDAPQGGIVAQLASLVYQVTNRYGRTRARSLFLAGAEIDAQVRLHTTTLSVRGLSIYLDFLLAGLAELVMSSEPAEGALEQAKAAAKILQAQPDFRDEMQREQKWLRALYGVDHPYAQERSSLDQIAKVGEDDLDDYRDRFYRAGNATLVVTGGFDMDLMVRHVNSEFGRARVRVGSSWNKKPERSRAPVVVPPPAGAPAFMSEVDPKRAMLDMSVSYPLANVVGPDHPALLVLNEMLAYRVGDIRERLGASYGIQSNLSVEPPHLTVEGGIDPARAAEGYAAVMAGLAVPEDDETFDRIFAFARRRVLRRLIVSQSDPALLAVFLSEAIHLGASSEYYPELVQRVAVLRPSVVRDLWRRLAVEGNVVTSVRGPQAAVEAVMQERDRAGAR